MKNGILLGCHHGLSDKLMKHMHDSVELFLKRSINVKILTKKYFKVESSLLAGGLGQTFEETFKPKPMVNIGDRQ